MNKENLPFTSNYWVSSTHGLNCVEVLGARTHNLKNIDVAFPHNQLVVITGVSGSGKSSLVFDTINAEGQRRYRESFSTYARNLLGNLARPEVDKINGLSPVIAIEQKTMCYNPRSTVGTITEIYDFMRLLFAKIAVASVPNMEREMVQQSQASIFDRVLQKFSGQNITLMAPLIKGKKGSHQPLLSKFFHLGFTKIRVNGSIVDLYSDCRLAPHKRYDLYLVIDHLYISEQNQKRIDHAIQLAMKYGQGVVVAMDDAKKDFHFSQHLLDEATGIAYDNPEPKLFSFNTPYGACTTCDGLGEIMQADLHILIPDPTKSIKEGAILPLGPYKKSLLFTKIEAVLQFYKHQITDSVVSIPQPILNLLLFGNIVKDRYGGLAKFPIPFEGIFKSLQDKQEKAAQKGEEFFLRHTVLCSDCQGARLNEVAQSFTINGQSIAALSMMNLCEIQKWITELPNVLTKKQQIIAHELLQEIHKRLNFLIDIGLSYLSLHRGLHTLSGGETQRIRLATQIGTQLLGVLYIVDEPSIGLHQRDNARLIASLQALKEIGNTVLVVEHDREMMLHADYLIEIGPKAGLYGGEVVAAGRLEEFLKQPSITADFLSLRRDFCIPSRRKKNHTQCVTVTGCKGNNLKNVTLSLPLGMVVCITGVSGSGKSSLIHRTLVPILKKHLYNSSVVPLPYDEAFGLEHVHKIIEVDQLPIGSTPRSNASTYIGMFTEVRKFFSLLPESKIRGYKPGRFSFNIKEGRCAVCEGLGIEQIDMGFLPDVYVTCHACMGKRYTRETLEVQYKGKSIADVLNMTVSDALNFFEGHASILNKLDTLEQVGLGYITLGQYATTLSGGEAQRIKLAAELAKTAKGNTLYVLDEPSTGLHFQDISYLWDVLTKIVNQGHSVLVIEHNMDIIKMADYVIDLGPEGGQEGGAIIAQGTPEEIVLIPESHTGFFLGKELNHV